MSNDDHNIGGALLLVAGGAAGYAVGRWVVEPMLAKPAVRAEGSSAPAGPRLRALASGALAPMGPYGGPSGEMRPLDPYVDASPSSIDTISSADSMRTSGPILSPSQVDPSLLASAPTPGPVSSPSQVALTTPPASAVRPSPAAPVLSPKAKFATSATVRRFDPIFARYRGNLPIEYVRALVERESDGRPDVRTRSAVGLMQIVPVVLNDYNKRHGTTYSSEQLVDPAINVAIGCELLTLIVTSYCKNHPHVLNLQADWRNPRFVELLTIGWNAGFSEAGGVGRVARYLEQLGATDITMDLVSAHAKLAGATKHLSNPAKVAWCKSVASLYLRERALVGASV